jgi:hypothetical protein
MSVFDATSTCAALELLESDSNQSMVGCARFLFELRDAALVNEEASGFESLSDLEDNLDRLLKIGDEGATAC